MKRPDISNLFFNRLKRSARSSRAIARAGSAGPSQAITRFGTAGSSQAIARSRPAGPNARSTTRTHSGTAVSRWSVLPERLELHLLVGRELVLDANSHFHVQAFDLALALKDFIQLR